jgi:hypothetical protein
VEIIVTILAIVGGFAAVDALALLLGAASRDAGDGDGQARGNVRGIP